MNHDITSATVSADFKYKVRQACIPATAKACREIPIVDEAETLVCTISKNKRLFGEVRGDGFFYFTHQETLGVRGMKEAECRIPVVENLIQVEYGREGEEKEVEE